MSDAFGPKYGWDLVETLVGILVGFCCCKCDAFGRRLVGSVARRIGSAILYSFVTYSWSKIGWNMLKRWLEFGRAFVFLDRLCLIDIFIEMLPTPLVLQQYEVI